MSTVETLMCSYGWAVNDFQRLARTLSLLVASLGSQDDLDAPSFYSDVSTLTNPIQPTPAGQKLAAAMGDGDRACLRKLKKTRDDLLYQFFLSYRLDSAASALPAGAEARLAEIRQDIDAGKATLERLYQALS